MIHISVIVPVYNTESYLRRCVDSILAQTFTDFELILVDDGSPDDCPAICDAYAEKDRRVCVIHQDNQGAAAARNTGLDAASGKYITFCDSDDYVSPKWLEHLLNRAACGVLPMCSYCSSEKMLGKEKPISKIGTEYRPVSDYFLYNCYGIAGFLCNALYDGEVIQKYHLRLREQKGRGDYNEDLLFALEYQEHIQQLVYVGYSDYLYDVQEFSLSRGNKEYYFDKFQEKYRIWKMFLKTHNREDELTILATQMVYRFMIAIEQADYKQMREMIFSPVVQEAIEIGDTSKENWCITTLIKRKAAGLLWLRCRIHKLKEKFL